MGFEFARPLAWLLLPVCCALIWAINRYTGTRRKSRKLTIANACRYVLALLLVAALSGPALLLPGNQRATWVLADLSASAQHEKGAMETALQTGLEYAPDTLQVGAIAFGGDAMVDAPLASGRTSLPLGTAPDASGTNIGRALSMALALLPEDTAGRILLLSDGQDNANATRQQIPALISRNIAVDVYALSGEASRDAQVTALTPPSQVYQGERFDVTVQVDSTYETSATIVLYANRQPVDTRDVTLRRGENIFVFRDTADHSGVVTYEAQLLASGDSNPRNDRLGAYIDVRGIPNILVLGDGTELSKMLIAAGMQVHTLLPGQLPDTAEALRQYHAIALDNVNADNLPASAMRALEDYVRKLGRGLCVFGGNDSYAIGGYRGSALESMMPVTMDVDNRLQMPSLSLLLVIDKSGSMSDGMYGVTRMDMAKEAALRATEVLTQRDNVGVIAFDEAAKWVVPLQQVEDLPAIQEMIGTIRAGGGTAFYSALAQALQVLVQAESQLKHVIFLTDGESADSGYESVIQQMAANGITLTSVAVGDGANATLLSRLAEYGNGRFYATNEFDDIPNIFTKETFLATQAYVQNRAFYPVVRASGPLTDYAAFPMLDGYLTTTARSLSTVALSTDRDEPLLAWWQYGAGRVLAWTSDTRGAWTADLLRWDDAAAFFAGMLLHVLPAEAGEGELDITQNGSRIKLSYRVDDEETLQTVAQLLAPDGQQQTLALSATAPGVYVAEFDAQAEGAYAIRIEQQQGDTLVRTLETGLAVGYSIEYDLRSASDGSLLQTLADTTGGRVLTDAAEFFTQQGAQAQARREITTALLIAALVLFVLDVAQRRLSWERWLPQRAQKPPVAPPAVSAPPPAPKKPDSPTPQTHEAPKPSETAEKLLQRRKRKLM